VYFSRCQARFNKGADIWFDISARDNVVDRCIVADNSDSGLEYEISDRAVFSNNIVIRNGFANNNAGIFISCSNDVLVVDNMLYGNTMGIVLNNYGRSEHPEMKNNMIVNNNIMASVYDDFVLALDPGPMESPWHGNVSDYNTYGRADGKIRITYRVYGSDPVYYRDLTELKNAASMEMHSSYGDPSPAVADKELAELIADSRDN
jgi:parallel beta-helix repeat protein